MIGLGSKSLSHCLTMPQFDYAERAFFRFVFFLLLLNNTNQTANKREIDIFIGVKMLLSLRNQYD